MNLRRLALILLLIVMCITGAGQALAFYNPGTGRWLSKDPIEEDGGINLYAAANNNFNSYYDPTGLLTTPFTGTYSMTPVVVVPHPSPGSANPFSKAGMFGAFTSGYFLSVGIVDGSSNYVTVSGHLDLSVSLNSSYSSSDTGRWLDLL